MYDAFLEKMRASPAPIEERFRNNQLLNNRLIPINNTTSSLNSSITLANNATSIPHNHQRQQQRQKHKVKLGNRYDGGALNLSSCSSSTSIRAPSSMVESNSIREKLEEATSMIASRKMEENGSASEVSAYRYCIPVLTSKIHMWKDFL